MSDRVEVIICDIEDVELVQDFLFEHGCLWCGDTEPRYFDSLNSEKSSEVVLYIEDAYKIAYSDIEWFNSRDKDDYPESVVVDLRKNK